MPGTHPFQGRIRRAAALAIGIAMLAAAGVSAPLAGAAEPPTPVKVVTGDFYSCALMSDATVRCWGSNAWGELGNGRGGGSSVSENPVALSLTGVQSLSAGDFHTCAVVTGGKLYCWGMNNFGQLGNGALATRFAPVNVTPAGKSVRLVTTGATHTCAATTDHKLYCWGSNGYGELGVDALGYVAVPTLVTALPAGPILALGSSWEDTCVQIAVLSGSELRCTGTNTNGRWGVVSPASSATFTRVASWDAGAREIVGGSFHRCVHTVGPRDFSCSGQNVYGQLGRGSTAPSVVWTAVRGPYTTIGSGDYHSCAYAEDLKIHEYRCWGDNRYGQLGIGSTDALRTSPTRVAGFIAPATAAEASIDGGRYHTCAIGRDVLLKKRVFCWGIDDSGQLGDGSGSAMRRSPVQVQGI